MTPAKKLTVIFSVMLVVCWLCLLPDNVRKDDHIATKHTSWSPENRMQERRRRVNNVCANISHGEKPYGTFYKMHQVYKKNDVIRAKTGLDMILVNDEKKFMYCVIFKVASTVTKKTLVLYSHQNISINYTQDLDVNDENSLKKHGLRKLNSYNATEIEWRMSSYFKAMFVRHPLKRLLSAFRDRLEQNNKEFRNYHGRQIIKHYRKNPSEESLKRAHDVKFGEFLHYVSDKGMMGLPVNEHWKTYYDTCKPCIMDYDFIGKLETYDEDISYLMHKLANHRSQVDYVEKQHGPSSTKTANITDSIYDAYYKEVDKVIIHNITRVYGIDFDLYNYE